MGLEDMVSTAGTDHKLFAINKWHSVIYTHNAFHLQVNLVRESIVLPLQCILTLRCGHHSNSSHRDLQINSSPGSEA